MSTNEKLLHNDYLSPEKIISQNLEISEEEEILLNYEGPAPRLTSKNLRMKRELSFIKDDLEKSMSTSRLSDNDLSSETEELNIFQNKIVEPLYSIIFYKIMNLSLCCIEIGVSIYSIYYKGQNIFSSWNKEIIFLLKMII